uniref:Ubiquitin-like domain-containing protein n=1 Tax=Branchiostoma floridae TaxID=7739 RepID=C3YFV3_BRAFL|eukprot:XP_002604748.1 hypothetical protein BRAFLDRAFT_122556 [Branchiostoma floridae]
MDLFIETLTGTAFELRVSPFETVISVKAKIQRLEGIPISQQHLIWRSVELEDDYCLHDYSITDGSTLKLVLAMRGGPINTRRVNADQAAESRSGFTSAKDEGGQSAVRTRVMDYGAPSSLAQDSSSRRDTDSSSEEERHQQDLHATAVSSPRKRQELQRIVEQKAETSSQGVELNRDVKDGTVQKEGLQGIEKEKQEVIQSLKKDFVGLEHRKAGTSAGFPSTVDSPFRRWEHGYVSAEARTVDLVNKVPVSLEKLGGRKEVQHLGSLVRSATKESLRGLSGKHRMPPEGLGYSSNAAGLRKHDRRIGTPDRSRLIYPPFTDCPLSSPLSCIPRKSLVKGASCVAKRQDLLQAINAGCGGVLV